MTVWIAVLLVVVAVCARDGGSSRPDGLPVDTATEAALSVAELEVRMPRGSFERAAFVGASHLLVARTGVLGSTRLQVVPYSLQ